MDLHLDLESEFKQPRKQKKTFSSSSVFVCLIVFSIGAYGGLLFYQKNELLKKMSRLQTSITTLETQIKDSQNEEEKHNFVSPDLTLKAIDERTEWSELILQIQALETGEVTFSNFTISANGETNISGIARSLTAVKTMLSRLQEHPQVVDPFIPRIELAEKPGPGLANVEFELLFTFIPN